MYAIRSYYDLRNTCLDNNFRTFIAWEKANINTALPEIHRNGIKDVITSYSIHYTKLYDCSSARQLNTITLQGHQVFTVLGNFAQYDGLLFPVKKVCQ